MRRGFTLIETVVYIGLVAFIIGGAVAVSFNIIEGSFRLDRKTVIQEEGSFVVRKIEWALSSASDVDTSVVGELRIIRHDGLAIVIKREQKNLSMSEDGGDTFLPLTSDRVSVSDFIIENASTTGAGPRGVEITLVIDDATFSTSYYLRQ